MEKYFDGKELYGDDFSIEQICEWYKQEAEAYADMSNHEMGEAGYKYHSINELYGYRYLKKIDSFENVLGFGSSWGYEFLPIVCRIQNLNIIESSMQTRSNKIGKLAPIYVTPSASGEIYFADNQFDLITSFGTLHHVPNVSYILSELFRVLKPKGCFLLREPITSMGNWEMKRQGLTMNERGIPHKILDQIICRNNVKILHKHYFGTMTPFLVRLTKGHPFFSRKEYYIFDKYLSKIFNFNKCYHPVKKWQRIAPQYVFYVLQK